MPPKKKPVAVLEAEGSRHYTKDELEDLARDLQSMQTRIIRYTEDAVMMTGEAVLVFSGEIEV